MSQFYILIVDDSPTTSKLIKLHLQNLGYEISSIANTAEDALHLIENNRPDLVLMDIRLGEGMNGIEAADIIMNKFDIPVIYVTSFSDDFTLERAKQSLPYGFINKPFRDKDLRVNIEIALSRKSNIKDKIISDDNNSTKNIQNGNLEYALLSEALDHFISGVIVLDEN